jgi:hypothetical protein
MKSFVVHLVGTENPQLLTRFQGITIPAATILVVGCRPAQAAKRRIVLIAVFEI